MPPSPSDGVGLCEDLDNVYQILNENDDLRRMINDMADNLL